MGKVSIIENLDQRGEFDYSGSKKMEFFERGGVQTNQRWGLSSLIQLFVTNL